MLLLGSAVLALSSARTPRCAASDLQRAPTSFTAHVLTVLDEKQNVLLDTPELISAAARMEAVTGIKSVKLPSKTSNSRLASRSSVRCAHRLGMAERGDLSSEISRKSYFSRFLGQKGVGNATIGGHAPRGAVCAPLGGLGRSQALRISTRRVFHGETSRYGRCLPFERVV